jgi:Amt family ammonium transporter
MENRSGCSKSSYSPFVHHLTKSRVVGALFIIGWNIVWTSLIMCFIKYILGIPLRMSEGELLVGDDMIHGEAAYTLGPCEAQEQLSAGHDIKRAEIGHSESATRAMIEGQDPHVEKGNSSGTLEIKED